MKKIKLAKRTSEDCLDKRVWSLAERLNVRTMGLAVAGAAGCADVEIAT